MADRNATNDHRGDTPERVAVYDRPDASVRPTNTTGTTGVTRGAVERQSMATWILPAVIVLLLILALLWWF